MDDSQLDPIAAEAAVISDPLSEAVARRDAKTIDLVREALDQGRTLLAFQPVVQTRSPEKPAFYEGLIRICDHDGRIIPARKFVDAVEDNEIGRLMDCAALRHGLADLAENSGLRLSINMSARSIGYSPWTRILREGLARDRTIGERLILEITERSAIAVAEVVQSFMSEYQDQGVAFALDDFGAGYSAFRYLRDFYFDILKIDGQYVRNISGNPDNRVLVQAMISMARHFDMLTVAEQVETAADMAMLQEIGIDCMQGYQIGVPTVRPGWAESQAKRA